MKKDCLKSVRMTQEVFNYINGFEGNSFNQKFENLILFCMKTEEEKKSKIELYDSMIDSRREFLNQLHSMERLVSVMQPMLETVSQQTEYLFKKYGSSS